MSTDTNTASDLTNMEVGQNAPIINSTTINTARVFLLETAQNVDVTSAMEYGPLIPLFKREQTNDKPSIWGEEFIDEFIYRLEQQNYNPEVDYLLIAGHMVPIAIWVASVTKEWDEARFVQLLLWSSGYGRYVVKKIGEVDE